MRVSKAIVGCSPVTMLKPNTSQTSALRAINTRLIVMVIGRLFISYDLLSGILGMINGVLFL